MVSALVKWFIRDSENTASPTVRAAYGTLCGILGIILNVFLFGFKFFAGLVSGSMAVTADAFNNLSDAGSSVITLLGFRLASQKPDDEHPFGHGRFEYISGLVVALAILLMGFELGKSSVEKILHPGDIDASILTFVILGVSVLVKLYMSFYNRAVGRKIDSAAMKATAADSLSDAVSTTVVILSMLAARFTPLKIDGWCGLAVALFILYAGIGAAKDTISPLLGQPPTKEFVEDIERIVMSHPEVLGIHDLVVHDYGPGRVMVSLHAEVDEKADILVAHDVIDNIERALHDALGCEAVIHMDPIAADDEETRAWRTKMAAFAAETFGQTVTIHDFRMVKGDTHNNLIFDIVVPYKYNLTDEQVKQAIRTYVSGQDGTYFAVVKIDRSYVNMDM